MVKRFKNIDSVLGDEAHTRGLRDATHNDRLRVMEGVGSVDNVLLENECNELVPALVIESIRLVAKFNAKLDTTLVSNEGTRRYCVWAVKLRT